MIPPSAFGANACLVIGYLWNAITGFRKNGPGDSSYIGQVLEVAIAGKVIVLHEAAIAVLIKWVSVAASNSGLT